MSCYGCGSSFSFFNKEHGCKNCGFAFCGKCLSKKIEVPKRKNEKHYVCNRCYNILSGKTQDEPANKEFTPPEAYLKRIAALQERESSGSLSTKNHHKHNLPLSHNKKMSSAEMEIAERLSKLKEKGPNDETSDATCTEADMRERLAKLKGENPAIQTKENKLIQKPANRRTEQAQIDDLLDEIAAEVDLDAKLPDPVQDIEQRLAKLKRQDTEQGAKQDEQSATDQSNNLNSSSREGLSSFQQNITCKDTQKQNATDVDEISPEELKKLMDETTQEVNRDAQKALEGLEKDKEIMKRLQEIKSKDKMDINKDIKDEKHEESDSDNENEDIAAAKIINQLMEEDKLEEAAAKDGVDISKPKKAQNVSKKYQVDDDELPYCVMCTEDATIRCHDCDLDLYCKRCWNESHLQFQMGDHRTFPYSAPKNIAV